jgi:DNA repair protein RecN (Recombination protein N)
LLQELRVKDLGIIEDLDWRLDAGFNVITGETGAGKSLIIDAVELLLTGTADEEMIRYGANEAHIEGVFILSADPRFKPVRDFLSEHDLTVDDDNLIISCTLKRSKSASIRINGHTSPKAVLRRLGELLIDIHGQSEHLSLLDKRSHLIFLDAYAHCTAQREEVASQYSDLKKIESAMADMQTNEKETARRVDYLKYQIDEIKQAGLQIGEEEELEQARLLASHADKIKQYSAVAYQALSYNDSAREPSSIMSKLSEAIQAMKKLTELDPSLKPQMDYLEKTIFGIEETARDIKHYCDNLEDDSSRLDALENRLELIRNLKRKYGHTIADVLTCLSNAEAELTTLITSSAQRIQFESERTVKLLDLMRKAEELSLLRHAGARRLAEDVRNELHDLDMSQMNFVIAINQVSMAAGQPTSDSHTYSISPDGIDQVEFTVSTNPGEPLKPLSKIASTGELSRFTLALKAALSQADLISVLIFDEIDLGIGGRSGDIIGRKLWALSRNHQVVCVTHLPQITAYADAHYNVQKNISGTRTISNLKRLNNTQRVQEMAAMLTGKEYSQTAVKNAAELLSKATLWKKSSIQSAKPAQLSF